jgi:hypothetical protein
MRALSKLLGRTEARSSSADVAAVPLADLVARLERLERRVDAQRDAAMLRASVTSAANLERIGRDLLAHVIDSGRTLTLAGLDAKFHRNGPAGRLAAAGLLELGDFDRVGLNEWDASQAARDSLARERKVRVAEAEAEARYRQQASFDSTRTAMRDTRDLVAARLGPDLIAAARAIDMEPERLANPAASGFLFQIGNGRTNSLKCLFCSAAAELAKGSAAPLVIEHQPLCVVAANMADRKTHAAGGRQAQG